MTAELWQQQQLLKDRGRGGGATDGEQESRDSQRRRSPSRSSRQQPRQPCNQLCSLPRKGAAPSLCTKNKSQLRSAPPPPPWPHTTPQKRNNRASFEGTALENGRGNGSMWHANASVANWSPPPGATKHPLLLSTHFFWSPRTKSHIYFSQKVRSVIYLCHRFSVQIISGCLCSGLVSIYLSGASLQGVKDGRLRDVPPRLPAFCDRGQLDRSGGCVLGHGSFPQHVGDGKHCLKMEFRCPGKRRKVGWWTRFALGMEHGGGRPGRQKQGANHTQGRSVGDEPSLTAIYSLLLLFAPLRPPHQPSSLHLPPLPSRSLSSIRAAFPWAILCCHGLGRVSFRTNTCVFAAAATAAAPANANPSHTPQHHVPHKAHQRRSAQDLLSTPSRLLNL